MAGQMTKASVMEHHIAEIQATALTAMETSEAPQETRRLLKRIVELAHYTQGVHRGLRTKDNSFNAYLAELCGIENLN